MKAEYFDNVLLKLKRQYSKDETVSALTKKLSETEILLGQRNDEIDELKEILKTKSDSLNHHKNSTLDHNKTIKESSLYLNLLKINKTTKEKLDSLRKTNYNLIAENLKLKQAIYLSNSNHT